MHDLYIYVCITNLCISARVSFAIDVNDISTGSAPSSSQNESSGARKTEMTECVSTSQK